MVLPVQQVLVQLVLLVLLVLRDLPVQQGLLDPADLPGRADPRDLQEQLDLVDHPDPVGPPVLVALVVPQERLEQQDPQVLQDPVDHQEQVLQVLLVQVGLRVLQDQVDLVDLILTGVHNPLSTFSPMVTLRWETRLLGGVRDILQH